MVLSIISWFCFVLFLEQVVSFPQGENKPKVEDFGFTKEPIDLFKIQEEAKVLIERDKLLNPQFVAIIHNKFPHPTFPGQRSPWFQVYVYSDYFKGLTQEQRNDYVKKIIKDKLFEGGFHRITFNCLTVQEEKDFDKYRPPEEELGGPTPVTSAESEYEGPMMKQYRAVLEKNFKIHHLEIIDSSDNYQQPANSEKFLTILLVSDEFVDKKEHQREQMVIDVLKRDMPWDVRGLALILTTKFEYDHVPDKRTKQKMQKYAAMLHTKQLIIKSGYRNITTTLSSIEHFHKIDELADRIYGPIGDKLLRDNSLINEEERQLAFDYQEYVETRLVKNTNLAIKKMVEYQRLNELSLERQMKNDTLLRECKKYCTFTSEEKRKQEFSDEKKRFHFDLLNSDMDTITPSKFYYDDQHVEELSTVRI